MDHYVPSDPVTSAKKTVGKRKAGEKTEAPAAAHDAKRPCMQETTARATVPKPPKQPRVTHAPIAAQKAAKEDLLPTASLARSSARARSVSSRLEGFSHVPVLPYVCFLVSPVYA